jgi:hypothetical protein
MVRFQTKYPSLGKFLKAFRWNFLISYGHLVHFVAIYFIYWHFLYFVDTCYISTIWVYCIKKNLATLVGSCSEKWDAFDEDGAACRALILRASSNRPRVDICRGNRFCPPKVDRNRKIVSQFSGGQNECNIFATFFTFVGALAAHPPQEQKVRVRIPSGYKVLGKRSSAAVYRYIFVIKGIVCVLKRRSNGIKNII